MIDTQTVDKIAPDYWRNSQLSCARFSGACILNGVKYVLDPVTDYLVREDIYKKELAHAKWAKAEKAKLEAAKQGGLFNGEDSGSS